MSNNTTFDDLMKKVDSRYTLVVVAAKQARKLTEKKDNDKSNDVDVRKPVTQALREIAQDGLRYRPTKMGIK